jgi:D-ribose pyranase
MKRDGILNEHINLIISRLGHTDLLAISDCGLPIPDGVLRVDISLVKGIPSFKEVVKAISEELVIERAFIAQEMRQRNTGCYDSLLGLLPGIEIVELPHEELKRMLPKVKAVIRTGEATPYANVILESGVNF